MDLGFEDAAAPIQFKVARVEDAVEEPRGTRAPMANALLESRWRLYTRDGSF
jgi:hypothetical protein